MELTKNIQIKVFEVLAEYKVKENNAPYIAILKFAYENGGIITPKFLREKMLKPMSVKACENLLKRLSKAGYLDIEKNHFEKEEFSEHIKNTQFILNDFGENAAKKEEYFKPKKGVLKVHIIEDIEFADQQIVKIEEYDYDPDKEHTTVEINDELLNYQDVNRTFTLKNGKFILEKFNKQIKVLEKQDVELIVEANIKNSRVKILDYQKNLEMNMDEIKEMILINYFTEAYDTKNKLLKVSFETSNLSLVRDQDIQNPKVSNTFFNPLILKNIDVSPINISEAKQWFFEMVKQHIDRYFFTDKEFSDFANSIAERFLLFSNKLKGSLSVKEMISKLDDFRDFYKKAKLETINYLNY